MDTARVSFSFNWLFRLLPVRQEKLVFSYLAPIRNRNRMSGSYLGSISGGGLLLLVGLATGRRHQQLLDFLVGDAVLRLTGSRVEGEASNLLRPVRHE